MFYDELTNRIGLEVGTASFLGYCIGFKGVSLQGKFRIEYFSTVEIILSFGKQKFYVYGQNMSIKDLDKGEVVIIGDIICTSSREVQI